MSFNVNQRSDGVRYDYTNLHPRFVSVEYIIYLRHACGSIGDDCSFKTGGGRHSDGSRPNCYIANLPSEGGSGIRLRFEADHPSGYSTLASGPGNATASVASASSGNWVGFSGIKRNMNGYILIQAWQDVGNNDGATPANQWQCVGSWDVRSPYHPTPPNDHQETWRIDGEECMEYKWNSLREINPNDTTTPGTGGVGGGIGGGGGFGGSTGSGQVPGGQIGGGSIGGGGAFDQMGNYVGSGNGTYDQYGNYVGYGSGSTGGGGSTGTGSGGTGTGIDTPSPQETQIVYERKEFMMRWNINFVSGDACGVGKSPETRPLKPIYEVSGDVYAEGKNYSRFGIYVAKESKTDPTKNSLFMNTIARYAQFVAKRQGANPLSGFIDLRIRDIDYNIVAELGQIDATIVTNSDQNLFLNFPNNIRKFKKGDHLSIEYNGSTQENFLRVKVSQKDKIDGNNTILFVYDGNAYIYDPFADLGGVVSI